MEAEVETDTSQGTGRMQEAKQSGERGGILGEIAWAREAEQSGEGEAE